MTDTIYEPRKPDDYDDEDIDDELLEEYESMDDRIHEPPLDLRERMAENEEPGSTLVDEEDETIDEGRTKDVQGP